jgi:crossover junction endodeoxyribonuclease RuvC
VGITVRQFEQMQERLGREKRRPAPLIPIESDRRSKDASGDAVLLGIDPSLRGTGFGVLRRGRPRPIVLASGTIRCPAGWERSRCLGQIARTIREVIQSHRPTVCVVEGLFYAQNLQTALIMGEARGVVLATAAEAGVSIYEIAPRKVKQAVVGYGAAQKTAVARMVQRLLALAEAPAPDAADALALALAHLQEQGRYNLVAPRRI